LVMSDVTLFLKYDSRTSITEFILSTPHCIPPSVPYIVKVVLRWPGHWVRRSSRWLSPTRAVPRHRRGRWRAIGWVDYWLQGVGGKCRHVINLLLSIFNRLNIEICHHITWSRARFGLS
jgi:hypothetical protein